MESNKKIGIVTGSRADWGLLLPLARELNSDPRFEVSILCTGMHLSPALGLTYREIEAAGFSIDRKVEVQVSSETGVGVAKSVALGVSGMADAIAQLTPDLLVVLGDRYETFAAAQAAMFLRVPLAHIQGGEVTEGAIDESIRHAITKMADLHFVSAEAHRKRVLQLGEDPARVHDVGALGVDSVLRAKLLSREALEAELGFSLGDLSFLVTYHPATRGRLSPAEAFVELLAGLSHFERAHVLFTKPNADEGGHVIAGLIDDYIARRPECTKAFVSLGQELYLSAVRAVDVVVGNSSSGLIEVPALGKPTVNVGDRQKGRLRGESVVDCEESALSVKGAIERALSAEFREILSGSRSPYGDGQAARRIKEILAATDFRKLSPKRFFDL